ncbi:MAG: cytochrome c oxidase accessory protein CcoG [Pirellulales bacterium]
MSSPKVAKPPDATSSGLHAGESLLRPEEHVLSTLEADGSRRWLFPKLAAGYFWNRRRYLAYFLIGVFAIIPHLRMNGKPLVLLDITARRFTILGYTFLPTDTLLLALLMVCAFTTIFFATALMGRIWCGWGCPQTVFMEFVFRPIDRLFQGTAGKGGTPKDKIHGWKWFARIGVYLLLAMFMTHTFLAYFVGVDRLAVWVRQSPFEHPVPFIVMIVTVGLMMFDFLYFREQTCLIVCPYGRFQSVMLDRRSLIVSYDHVRGEPRGKATKKQAEETSIQSGDCVDCGNCVRVCPTGIDIRNGLQMECIHCTQCIDACDAVMVKLQRPQGLIRYSNQDAIERKPSAILRARLLIYPIVLLAGISAFTYIFVTKKDFDAKLYRNLGNSFSIGESGLIDNSLRLSLTNRTDNKHSYQMKILTPDGGTVRSIESELVELDPQEHRVVPILISVPFEKFDDARCQVQFHIRDDQGEERTIKYMVLGPYQLPKKDTP